MKNSQATSFLKHTHPVLGRKFRLSRNHLQRIRAVHAMQGTAMRDFRNQRQWVRNHLFTKLCSAAVPAAVVGESRPHTGEDRCPRDSRQDAGATKDGTPNSRRYVCAVELPKNYLHLPESSPDPRCTSPKAQSRFPAPCVVHRTVPEFSAPCLELESCLREKARLVARPDYPTGSQRRSEAGWNRKDARSRLLHPKRPRRRPSRLHIGEVERVQLRP